MENLILRLATATDVPGIVGLWCELAQFHAIRHPYFAVVDNAAELYRNFVSRNIESDRALVCVAEQNGALIAFCNALTTPYPPVFTIREYASITDFAVTARCRRQGVGARLFDYVCAEFRRRGLTRIELHVATSNEVSTRFWAAMGMQPVLEVRFREL